MISSNLIFSKAAALRILKFATKIETIRVFKGAIQVTYLTKNGRCSTFLSKTAFFHDFIAFRQEGAKSVTVERWGAGSYENYYSCHGSDGERSYTVKLIGGRALCECRDYEKQHQELGNVKPGCKHVLATIQQLGYSSLEKYLNAVSDRAKADLFGGGWDEQQPALMQVMPKLLVAAGKKVKRDPFGGFNF